MRARSTSSPRPSSAATPTRSRSTARPSEYRCAPLVELHLLEWAHTIARRYLYEEADRVRIEALKAGDDAELAGLAAKIDREEVYHRMHAEMWAARLRDEPRFRAAVDGAVAVRARRARAGAAARARARAPDCVRTPHKRSSAARTPPSSTPLWDEMTEVRRSVPGAQW